MNRIPALLLAICCAALPAAAQTTPVPAASPLDDLAFLAGCWAGDFGTLELRESWTEPAGSVMLGTTRYLRGGEVVDWEFARLFVEDGVPVLQPYPKGERAARGFPLVSREGGVAVFENLEHDFPVRIIYRPDGPDRLTPRIEGADGRGRSWELARVACPG